MKPEEIIASATAFSEWWQTRQPANQDRAIKKAAEDAGLIFTGKSGLIFLTASGRVLRGLARPVSRHWRNRLAREDRHHVRSAG